MRITLIYDPKDHKLQPTAYSQTYRQMFLALTDRFDVQEIHSDCNADSIEGDAVIFYDIHSSHLVDIYGIEGLDIPKYEYLNDPHQLSMTGEYLDGQKFVKLGAHSRCKRVKKRGIDYIITPYRDAYYRYLSPFLDNPDEMLVWFPVAPKKPNIVIPLLDDRMNDVIVNGHTGTLAGQTHYELRKWLFEQDFVRPVLGCVQRDMTPKGDNYIPFLSNYAGVVAACDTFPVPKYFEACLAGCVGFFQWHKELYDLGFRHGKNCVFIDSGSVKELIEFFNEDVTRFQGVADAGRKLVEENYTADKFAEFIENHIRRHYEHN